jgi:hypothetical protein
MGRHPALWKQISEEVFRKPGKDDDMKPKAYRSISLQSCMGQVVEKVVADTVLEEAERRGLLHQDNLGAGRGSQPSTQRLSWLTQLMQPGQTTT